MGDGLRRAAAAAKATRKPETLLQILGRCVGGLDSAPGRMLARVWALELRIAQATSRREPRDAYIVLAAFEAREQALLEELAALEKSN